MIKLGLLGSTRGTHLLTISKAIEQQQLNASIEMVISNKAHALILERAKAQGFRAIFLDPKGLTRSDYDKKMTELFMQRQVDLVVLVGYMRILSEEFVSEWQEKVINVHPSLLPAFGGKMNNDVHEAVLQAGLKETGCTIHYVTSELDAGPILLQKKCPILDSDTVESLKARVQDLEGRALVEVIQSLTVNHKFR